MTYAAAVNFAGDLVRSLIVMIEDDQRRADGFPPSPDRDIELADCRRVLPLLGTAVDVLTAAATEARHHDMAPLPFAARAREDA